jgi:hypothetical protein
MTTSEPYGQTAYEEYCERAGWTSKFSGDHLPQWKDADPDVKEWFEAAAQAVLHRYAGNPYRSFQVEPTRGPSA